jgi:hypothetical protein
MENNNQNKLKLKSISEILGYDFFIPSYQRGYKWDKQQVLDLLNDIYEFSKNNKGFYCLQPLVVKFNENSSQYIVIDGQQRLTTIFIILKYLEKNFPMLFSNSKLFSIDYETRKKEKANSKEFLENIIFLENIDYSNPDFYYMSKAYKVIENWFKDDLFNKSKKILDLLMTYEVDKNGIDKAINVRFIWYELEENENEIEVFTRLNIGKIPLSNSELIKAIILSQLKNYEKTEIVAEWDYIEKNLQNDRFFSFLTKKKYKNTRIDFIFNLLAEKYKKEYNLNYKNDDRFSFYVFNHLIKESLKNEKELWSEVKKYFRIFEELYNNNIYYHYVGFFINSSDNDKIDEIINIYQENKKDEFKTELEKFITIEIYDKLENLNYENNRIQLEKILFLFNVLITMESGYSRYPFDIHNKEEWSLEHIHAQNSEEIKDKKQLLELQLNSPYIIDDNLKNEIGEFIKSSKYDNETFIKIQNEIYKQFTDEDEEIHSIDNLALLSKNDNSSLNNSIFPEKRSKIKKLDEKGKFIPLGTKNVFMKYYSDKVDEFLTWNREDRLSYLEVLKNKLTPFIKDK